MIFKELRSLYEFLDEEIFLLAGKAVQVICWDKDHQYCGRCGTHTELQNMNGKSMSQLWI
jgi:NAD+ diphosphatase